MSATAGLAVAPTSISGVLLVTVITNPIARACRLKVFVASQTGSRLVLDVEGQRFLVLVKVWNLCPQMTTFVKTTAHVIPLI